MTSASIAIQGRPLRHRVDAARPSLHGARRQLPGTQPAVKANSTLMLGRRSSLDWPGVKLADIIEATGLSKSFASTIRAGRHRPHPITLASPCRTGAALDGSEYDGRAECDAAVRAMTSATEEMQLHPMMVRDTPEAGIARAFMPRCWTIGGMWIAQLRYPGSFVDGLSQVQAHTTGSLLQTAENSLTDAALSLTLFEASLAIDRGPKTWARRREREQELRCRTETRYAEELGHLPQQQRWVALNDMREKLDEEARRLGWSEGDVPESYEHRLPFLHARAFLFALDSVGNLLRVLAGEPCAPVQLAGIRNDWLAAFLELRHVRDTAHHMEDRARGLDKNGKPLALAPINNELLKAPGGVLILDSLIDNRFGCTMSDGTYGEVEVSGTSLEAATTLVQRTIDVFTWKGPARTVP